MTDTVLSVPGIENLNGSQLRALRKAADELGIQPDWLATVISFETGKTFSPSIVNQAGSGAFGLIQFMPSTAKAILKTSTNHEATVIGKLMTFNQQMTKMVIPYLKPFKGRMNSLNDVYLAIFYPAAMNKESGFVIGSSPSAVYTQNAGFDKSGKGYVTRADVTSTITNLYNSSHNRERTKIPSGIFGQIFAGLMASSVIVGGMYAAQNPTQAKRILKTANTRIKGYIK